MGRVRLSTAVALPPDRALALWADVGRWPAFVDGFARVRRADPGWPERGSRVEWESAPGGRGVVAERVERHEGGRLVTRVEEEALTGTQRVAFAREEGETRVELELEYELSRGGPLGRVTDALFIRRAQSDSLERTLRRFVAKAAEEAAM